MGDAFSVPFILSCWKPMSQISKRNWVLGNQRSARCLFTSEKKFSAKILAFCGLLQLAVASLWNLFGNLWSGALFSNESKDQQTAGYLLRRHSTRKFVSRNYKVEFCSQKSGNTYRKLEWNSLVYFTVNKEKTELEGEFHRTRRKLKL